jgi:2-dehydro-3-deoxygluconokinase
MVYKISVVGPVNIDLIIRGNAPKNIKDLVKWADISEVYSLTAGAAGYISQNLKKLGNDIHLVSCIGDDSFGAMIKNSLEKLGINTKYIIIEPRTESAIAIYMLLFGDKKRPATFKMPTHHGWPVKFSKEIINYLLDADLLHSAGYLHFQDLWNEDFLNLFKEAKTKGLLTSIDPQFPLKPIDPPWLKILKPLIPFIDILMIDEIEAINFTGKKNIKEAANLLFNEGIKKIAIKLGEKGVMIKDKEFFEQIPATRPKVFVDSIGAGDAFDAAFLQGILEGKNIIDCGMMGVLAATKSIEGIGSTENFPTRETLEF